MNKKIYIAQIYDIIREKIENGGDVIFKPKGISMLPTIRENIDKVILEKPKEKINKYDIVFYRRKNGQFVLHRVIGVNNEGKYCICGDNQWVKEENIGREQIIARVKGIYRGERLIECDKNFFYKLYSILWSKIRITRRIRDKINRIRNKVKKLFC